MMTVLFLLLCLEDGIAIRNLDLLTIVMLMDMWKEKGNDDVNYARFVWQEEFDKF